MVIERSIRARLRKAVIPVVATAFALFLAGCAAKSSSSLPTPKNVIVIIGDGMGFNQVQASSYYQHGEADALSYQQWPVKMGMSTYSASGSGYDQISAHADFDYFRKRATDSAASATAMGTGTKTYNGAIGLDMNKEPLETLCEFANSVGKASGVVTSVNFPHATPAGFIAHAERRGMLREIANEMVFGFAEVIMGAGHPLYNDDGQLLEEPKFERTDTEEIWNMLVEGGIEAGDQTVMDIDGDGTPDPWTLVQTREEFEALAAGSGATPKRVMGIAQMGSTLQERRTSAIGDMKAEDPFTTPFVETAPSIATMTVGALNVLSQNPNGFFVMIEAGGAVDWACHSNYSGRMIEEQIEMNKAVDAVIEWIETNSSWDETMVIVTADHETGYLWGPGSGNITNEDGSVTAVWNPIVGRGKGEVPDMVWHSGGHTNQLVPFYAKGMGSELLVDIFADEWDAKLGYYINSTEFAQLIKLLWRQ